MIKIPLNDYEELGKIHNALETAVAEQYEHGRVSVVRETPDYFTFEVYLAEEPYHAQPLPDDTDTLLGWRFSPELERAYFNVARPINVVQWMADTMIKNLFWQALARCFITQPAPTPTTE